LSGISPEVAQNFVLERFGDRTQRLMTAL